MTTVRLIKKAKANNDGQHPIQIIITLNRRSIRINTGKTIDSKLWDDKLKKVKFGYPNYRHLNNYLQSRINEIELTILNLESKDSDFTLEMIRARLNNTKIETVFKRGEEFFDELLLASKIQ